MGDNMPQKCVLKLFGPSQKEPLKSSGDHKSSESTSKFLNFSCLLHSMQGDEKDRIWKWNSLIFYQMKVLKHIFVQMYTL